MNGCILYVTKTNSFMRLWNQPDQKKFFFSIQAQFLLNQSEYSIHSILESGFEFFWFSLNRWSQCSSLSTTLIQKYNFPPGNAVVGDVDNDKRLSAYLSLNDRKVIRYKDSSPLQTTTVIVGGFFDMQVGFLRNLKVFLVGFFTTPLGFVLHHC